MSVERMELGSLGEHLRDHIDLLICSASFEDRCRSICDQVDPKHVGAVRIIENLNHKALHSDHPAYLLKRFEGKGRIIGGDTTDPLATADALAEAIAPFARPAARVLVDVTTFTHEALLILFRLVEQWFPRESVRFAYAGAKEYSIGDAPAKKWLSKGIGEIRSVLGFPGRLVPSRRFHLIVLVGFEHERVAELIRRYEPSVISLGYPDSAQIDASKHSATNAYGLATLKAVFGDAREFTFPCYDPVGTKEAIRAEQRAAGDEMNVVVAPMNTKVSAIGAALAAIEDESIQICYAQAIVYNYLKYSVPGDVCYIFDFAGTP